MTFEERKEQVKSYLGKKVVIGIDRPIGCIHKKENYSLTYPINYGYIPDVIAVTEKNSMFTFWESMSPFLNTNVRL